MSRKKKLPFFEALEIVDIAAEGKSIAKVDQMIVFIPGMVPGDIVDVRITRKKRHYMEGAPTRMVKESPDRINPFCKHFGVCGGCKWQNLPYERQLFYKQKQVKDNLERIGKVDLPEIPEILASHQQKYYRNKLEFTFSESRWLTGEEIARTDEVADRRALGFHIPGMFDRIVDIDECFLQDDLSNRIRNRVKEFTQKRKYSYYFQRKYEGFMRNLIVRNSTLGEWMVIVIFQYSDTTLMNELLGFIRDEFPEIVSLMYMINPKVNDTINDLQAELFSGRDHIFEVIDNLRFKIGPKSFFQTNTQQAKVLYQKTLEFAALKGDEVVYDLYTGTGTIANYVARKCKSVVGIEFVEEAIEDAHVNAELNDIKNASFFAGDMKDVLTEKFIADHGRPDVIITDPPRAGMHPDVIQTILWIGPERIIYVSCNPATQARDIQLLSIKYKVTAIQPVDMFPHTHHVENIVRLDRC